MFPLWRGYGDGGVRLVRVESVLQRNIRPINRYFHSVFLGDVQIGCRIVYVGLGKVEID